jgi:hypothetical protein
VSNSSKKTAVAPGCVFENPPRQKSPPSVTPSHQGASRASSLAYRILDARLVCGRRPTDVQYLRSAQNRAIGRKASDEFTVPQCRGHHRELDRSGNEAAWWGNAGVDPIISARALWFETRPLRAGPDSRATALADLPVAGTTDQVKSDDDRPVRFRSTDRTTTSDQTTAPDEVA